jgi:hypothetical protein
LVQQVTTSNGNLAALFHYVRDPRQATAGWTLAYGVLGAELRPVGAWVTGNDNDGIGFTAVSDVWPAVVVVALLVCTGLLAWWRGRRDAARLSAVAAVSVVLAVIATSKLTGDVAFYLTRWWWAVAAIANLAVVWALISVFDSRRLRDVVTGLALLGIVVAGVMSVGDLPASFAQSDMIEAVGRLNGSTPSALDHQTRYLVQSFDTSQLGFVSKGLFVSLRRQGFQVFVPPDSVSDIEYGSWRVATPDRVDALLSVVDIAEPGWQPPPNGRLVASYDPLSPAERAPVD